MRRRISRARSSSACTDDPPAGGFGAGVTMLPESGVVMAEWRYPLERECGSPGDMGRRGGEDLGIAGIMRSIRCAIASVGEGLNRSPTVYPHGPDFGTIVRRAIPGSPPANSDRGAVRRRDRRGPWELPAPSARLPVPDLPLKAARPMNASGKPSGRLSGRARDGDAAGDARARLCRPCRRLLPGPLRRHPCAVRRLGDRAGAALPAQHAGAAG